MPKTAPAKKPGKSTSLSFGFGFFISIPTLIIAVSGLCILYSLYMDYKDRGEAAQWLLLVQDVQKDIEENHSKHLPLNQTKPFDREKFDALGGDIFEVTESGMIIMRGKREGPDFRASKSGKMIVLIPSFLETGTRWRCLGGHVDTVPAECQPPG